MFALEREWLQQIVFQWTNHRLRFLFDASHVERASHHQKFVVADGEISFLGGLDLCDHRWDDRHHKNKNLLRTSPGEPHKPFHDVQAYLRGREVARALTALFVARWRRAGGPPIALPDDGAERTFADHQPEGGIPLPASEAALSRTDPRGSPAGPSPCTEIRDLFVDAIGAAERFIYIETQYFTSHVVADAIERRMRAEGRPALDIVLLLNMGAETVKEQIAIGLSQAEVLGRLRAAAAETGHRLGGYYTLPDCGEGETAERAAGPPPLARGPACSPAAAHDKRAGCERVFSVSDDEAYARGRDQDRGYFGPRPRGAVRDAALCVRRRAHPG